MSINSKDYKLLRRIAKGEIKSIKLPNDLAAHIDRLITSGLAIRVMPGHYYLTDAGRAAVYSFEHSAEGQDKRNAKSEKNRKADIGNLNQQQRKSLRNKVLIAAVGSAVAFIFDHVGEITQLLCRLLQRISVYLGHG